MAFTGSRQGAAHGQVAGDGGANGRFTTSAGWFSCVPLVYLAGFTLLAVGFSHAQQLREAGAAAPRWEVLESCRLLTNAVVDGDSFHVIHKGREYIFRLYFVDAPETDIGLRDRAVDQAAYFGIAPEDVPGVATLASRFTRRTLEGSAFTVITRWQNAMGRSSLARYYAIVLVNGKNLAQELVANGFARIYGLHANWPDGPRSTTFISQLKNVELNARAQKLGVWDPKRFPRKTGMKTTNPIPPDTLPARMDVNTATYEELQQLPGIGPVLAERIIANRPYKTVEELKRVSGIGSKTLERLTPLIQAGNSPRQ